MSVGQKNLFQLKDIILKGAAVPLKAIPLWVEAIGAGVFLAAVIEKNPRFKARLVEIDGKVFLFEAVDIEKRIYLHIKDCDIKCLPHLAGAPDVTMKGSFAVLLDLLLGRVDPDTVFFSRKLEITGDTATAIHFKNLLAGLG